MPPRDICCFSAASPSDPLSLLGKVRLEPQTERLRFTFRNSQHTLLPQRVISPSSKLDITRSGQYPRGIRSQRHGLKSIAVKLTTSEETSSVMRAYPQLPVSKYAVAVAPPADTLSLPATG